MTTCNGIGFSEVARCGTEDGHRIAHGWTQSTGQSGAWAYTLPIGWAFDPKYPDIRGAIGSHGGCSSCIMTLVHLREIVEAPAATTPNAITVAAAIIAAYLILRR